MSHVFCNINMYKVLWYQYFLFIFWKRKRHWYEIQFHWVLVLSDIKRYSQVVEPLDSSNQTCNVFYAAISFWIAHASCMHCALRHAHLSHCTFCKEKESIKGSHLWKTQGTTALIDCLIITESGTFCILDDCYFVTTAQFSYLIVFTFHESCIGPQAFNPDDGSKSSKTSSNFYF